jgi:hypothetical protein
VRRPRRHASMAARALSGRVSPESRPEPQPRDGRCVDRADSIVSPGAGSFARPAGTRHASSVSRLILRLACGKSRVRAGVDPSSSKASSTCRNAGRRTCSVSAAAAVTRRPADDRHAPATTDELLLPRGPDAADSAERRDSSRPRARGFHVGTWKGSQRLPPAVTP